MSETSYRKKPVVIEAMQFTLDTADEIRLWAKENDILIGWQAKTLQLIIPTLEGDLFASLDDWIIRGVQGEFYPCKPDIFAATYEPAGNDLTVDQARTQDLERRGLHGAVVRSDGLRAVVELGHVQDFEKLLDGSPTPRRQVKFCSRCSAEVASICSACATSPSGRVWSCEGCGAKFSSETNVVAHAERAHPQPEGLT